MPKRCNNRFQWKRTDVSNEQLAYVKKAFTLPQKKDVAEHLGISIFVLDRILDELGINTNFTVRSESKEHKKKRIKYLYENTDLSMNKLVESLNLHYEEVLTLIHEMYTADQIKERSARLYSRSKSGDNNPGRIKKLATGHGANFRGGNSCDDGNGYNLVPNEGGIR